MPPYADTTQEVLKVQVWNSLLLINRYGASHLPHKCDKKALSQGNLM
jgi:hypothetical protein